MSADRGLIDIAVAVTLDDACKHLHRHGGEDAHFAEMHVAPDVYASIVAAKTTQHLDRGNPLLLLALEVVCDDGLPPGRASIC